MPLPYDDVYDAIVAYVGNGTTPGAWDYSVAPLYFENTIQGPPPGAVAPWVPVMLDSQQYSQQSLGGGQGADGTRWDESGRIWFHVFTPRGTGSRDARRIAKGLANLFRGTTLLSGNLNFGDADMGAGDPGSQNANYYLL